tara:strand:+ start:266 stop:751 length:486 start_codon:yes stop_codon:yes gene_type:complete
MLNICQKLLKSVFIIVVGSSIAGQVWAHNYSSKSTVINSIDKYWVVATDEELALQRGGFVLPNGVTIDISLERIILLNGIETSSTFFQFPESNTLLLQSGNENMAPDSIGSTLGTVIQNSLDDQIIKAINEINIEISNLQNAGFDHSNHYTHFDSILPMLQ